VKPATEAVQAERVPGVVPVAGGSLAASSAALHPALREELETLSGDEQGILARMVKRWRKGAAPGESFDVLTLIHENLTARLDLDPSYRTPDADTMVAPPMVKEFPGTETVSLPTDLPPLDVPLSAILKGRFSDHNFGPGPLSLRTLSSLLHYSYGTKKVARAYNTREFPFRQAPSAGGLQPIDLYVVANSVEELRQGLYYFDPNGHRLRLLDEGNLRRRIVNATVYQDWLAYAQVVFILVCNMPRVQWKYGDRAYRFVHVDAGVLTQNLYLVSTALKLTTCAVAAYVDDSVNQILEVDGRSEFTILLFGVGHKPRSQKTS
jgi:SagB-type dehydrogenase family enzyme